MSALDYLRAVDDAIALMRAFIADLDAADTPGSEDADLKRDTLHIARIQLSELEASADLARRVIGAA